MPTNYKFSLDEIKKLSQKMVVLCDSREKMNQHIMDYFDKNKISYRREKLNYGDYSFVVPSPREGINDIYFHKEIVVERKNSLEELSGSIGKERERFEREMLKACKDGCRTFLMVENKAGFSDIMEHNYNTDYKPLPYIASLRTFENRYGIRLSFIDRQYAGYYIYSTFYYFMREHLA